MSHDLYASWATAEISRMIRDTPQFMFDNIEVNNFDVFANRESGRIWPIPDGRLSAEINPSKFEVAIELKRTNEGLHGVLTAIGQAQAYIHKGYSGAAIIVPNSYDSFPDPGTYISNVLHNTSGNLPIGVFTYDSPDTTNSSPFLNKVRCIRPINLSLESRIGRENFLSRQRSVTQWAHLREGSTEAYAFYKYLQIAKQLNANDLVEPNPHLPQQLIDAVSRINVSLNPISYLSFATGIAFHDVVWRTFWYNNVLTDEVAIPWFIRDGEYVVNSVKTKLKLPDGTYQEFFSSRVDSVKQKIVLGLNNNGLTEEEAWDIFANNIHNRAHSYREDIDSGLEHLGLINSDGKPSENGYKYVDACERTNNCHLGKPKLILGASILKEGSLGAFLHYVYKVSENRFKLDPLAFTEILPNGRRRFNKNTYLAFIREELANTLHVMNTATIRGGAARNPFQGELAILRKFDFVSGFRIGVGLEINWPLVQEYLEYKI
ncbi:hypothetical protein [Flavobacterium sp. AG291]|uniref:hypothetical protein n=1 Tax=Flavobacterium sp. AG291 TaxID=2184000 RepID=UPI000E0AE484|nr:hypothetical protein [Flavobacterium sp. AG291]RDI05348.1 hypothetical protein DEU42_11821 [Flavobacterium sp. AG291]